MQLMIILALTEGWYDHPVQRQQGADKASNRNLKPGNVQSRFVWVISDQVEEAMYRCLAAIAGTLAILSLTVLISGRAEAGASASAPSKYAHANRVASQKAQLRQAGRNDFGITEFSSSSAKHRSQQH
jgi:hypothetical protein